MSFRGSKEAGCSYTPGACCFNTFTNAIYELTVKALRNMTYLSVICCHFKDFWDEMAPVPSDLRSLRSNHHKEEAPAGSRTLA